MDDRTSNGCGWGAYTFMLKLKREKNLIDYNIGSLLEKTIVQSPSNSIFQVRFFGLKT